MIANTSISQLQASGAIKKRKTRKAKVEEKEVNQEALNQFLTFATKVKPGRIEIVLPLRTVSEANCFEPWRKKYKRHKAQKRAVTFALIPVKQSIKLPCLLRITRYAPKELDAHDNLRMAVKYILDQCCAEITNDFRPGRADSNAFFTFEYDQKKCKTYAVKIEISF